MLIWDDVRMHKTREKTLFLTPPRKHSATKSSLCCCCYFVEKCSLLPYLTRQKFNHPVIWIKCSLLWKLCPFLKRWDLKWDENKGIKATWCHCIKDPKRTDHIYAVWTPSRGFRKGATSCSGLNFIKSGASSILFWQCFHFYVICLHTGSLISVKVIMIICLEY